jgi:glutaredoxin
MQNEISAERTKCEIWTRVMGYHRPVSQYNHGKKSEFYSRTYFESAAEENARFNGKYGQTSLLDANKGWARLMLFTTASCPKCPAVKAWLDSMEINYEMMDNRHADFYKLAEKYNIHSVPTLIALDSETAEVWRASEHAEIISKLTC